MRVPKISPSGWGWVGLWGYVAIVDGLLIRYRQDSLSTGFGKSITHPRRRWPTIGIWAILTVHLFAALFPEALRAQWRKVDPIAALARLVPSTTK